MNRTLVLLVCLAFQQLSVVARSQDSLQLPSTRVLVIGIDGTRPDALEATKTPHIDALIADGLYVNTTQILGERYQKNDTISGPGWSSFLIGVWADKHGVQDNSFTGKNYIEYPHFFTRVKSQFPAARTGSFVDWGPIEEHIVSAADVNVVYAAHGADDYITKDAVLTHDAVEFLSHGEPHVAMVYLGQVDETGHRHGFHPSVPQYITAIETVDSLVGELMHAVQQRPNYKQEDWLVIISTDHGGVGLGHGGGHQIPEIRTTFMIVSGAATHRKKLIDQTYVVDVVPTALHHLGVKIQPEWKLDGRNVLINADQ